MLLRRIAREKGSSLKAFSKVAADTEFLKLAGDMIVQLKQNDVSPQTLASIIEESPKESLLTRKLSDMLSIYSAYEQAMKGKYTDSEDLLQLVTSRLRESRRIAGAEIWYYGFYSFTKREAAFLAELSRCSCGLNMVMTLDVSGGPDSELFDFGKRSLASLRDAAGGLNVYSASGYYIDRPQALRALEKNLYAFPPEVLGGSDQRGLELISCSGPFTQAETIASEILRRVRTGSCGFGDIAVLTEDMQGQGAVIKNVLGSLGIPVFVDEKSLDELKDKANQINMTLKKQNETIKGYRNYLNEIHGYLSKFRERLNISVNNVVLNNNNAKLKEFSSLFEKVSLMLFELDDILLENKKILGQNIENILENIQTSIND